MKRGRDEKVMEPMFPRLHVNDAFKGGPRAPPRNKMALYEQLSIPSQRFHSPAILKPNSASTDLVRATSRHDYENQYCLSSDSSLVQTEQRKKLVEDDYRVPICIHSTSSIGLDESGIEEFERDSTSNPENKRRPNSKVSAIECKDDTLNSSSILKSECFRTQAGPFMPREPNENPVTTSHRPKTDGSIENSKCMEDAAALGKRKSSPNSKKNFHPQNQNVIPDSSNNMSCLEDGSCNTFQVGNLERDDSVSETSVLETESSMESITPDDVVGLIGQKRFWKARRTIADQQRIFSIQVFELHKLIKVQKSASASSHHLPEEETAVLSIPVRLPKKKPPSDSCNETMSNVRKQSVSMELPSIYKESTAENAFEKAPVSASGNREQSSKDKPPKGTPLPATISSSNCGSLFYFSQLQGHQLLIPVVSPAEGLVYKPYSGPCFPGQSCGACGSTGSNPNPSNFMAPVCGVPAPPHCPMPFTSMGPYGYFPAFGAVMNAAPFSGSPKDEMHPPAFPSQVPAGDFKAVPNARQSEDAEVLASTASSPVEVGRSSRGGSGMGPRGIFPIFTPAANPSRPNYSKVSVTERRPIKVVPHNSISASESAARIFRSIQQERKLNDV